MYTYKVVYDTYNSGNVHFFFFKAQKIRNLVPTCIGYQTVAQKLGYVFIQPIKSTKKSLVPFQAFLTWQKLIFSIAKPENHCGYSACTVCSLLPDAGIATCQTSRNCLWSALSVNKTCSLCPTSVFLVISKLKPNLSRLKHQEFKDGYSWILYRLYD